MSQNVKIQISTTSFPPTSPAEACVWPMAATKANPPVTTGKFTEIESEITIQFMNLYFTSSATVLAGAKDW